MSLVVLTGAARSGKSSAAERLAAARGRDVIVAVAGWDGDGEMVRRIEAHRAVRPEHWSVIEVGAEPDWVASVGPDTVLVLDCLATLVGTIAWDAVGDSEIATAGQEALAEDRAAALVEALQARDGDTVVVTNESGWGVVPATAAGRLFRDLLGRANRMLVDASDAAYLVVDGRLLDLHALPAEPDWPAPRQEGL